MLDFVKMIISSRNQIHTLISISIPFLWLSFLHVGWVHIILSLFPRRQSPHLVLVPQRSPFLCLICNSNNNNVVLIFHCYKWHEIANLLPLNKPARKKKTRTAPKNYYNEPCKSLLETFRRAGTFFPKLPSLLCFLWSVFKRFFFGIY